MGRGLASFPAQRSGHRIGPRWRRERPEIGRFPHCRLRRGRKRPRKRQKAAKALPPPRKNFSPGGDVRSTETKLRTT